MQFWKLFKQQNLNITNNKIIKDLTMQVLVYLS